MVLGACERELHCCISEPRRKLQTNHHLRQEVLISSTVQYLRTDLGTDQADLPVEVGASGVLEIADRLSKEDSGKFFDIYVPDWDKTSQFNRYEGGTLPW